MGPQKGPEEAGLKPEDQDNLKGQVKGWQNKSGRRARSGDG